MPRPKKVKPNRSDNRHEVKITVGKTMDGKLLRKSFYSTVSKADAQKKAEEFKINSKATEIAGLPNINDIKAVNFSSWAHLWLNKYKKGRVKENTYAETYLRTVEKYLNPYFGKAELKSIRPIDVQNFYNEMSEAYHETTLKKMSLCLNAIFNTAIDNDLCYKNPAKYATYTVKKENEKKATYTNIEVEKILKFSDTHKYGLYIRLLLELGLRCSELLGLKWSDIDFDNRTVSISRAIAVVRHSPVVGPPKSKGSKRTIPIGTSTMEVLKARRPGVDGYIVLNSKNNLYTNTNFTTYRYDRFFEDLIVELPEIKRLCPHELRHTCGTLLYGRTKDIFAVSKFLGHSDINITTKLYVHDNPEMLRDKLNIV